MCSCFEIWGRRIYAVLHKSVLNRYVFIVTIQYLHSYDRKPIKIATRWGLLLCVLRFHTVHAVDA